MRKKVDDKFNLRRKAVVGSVVTIFILCSTSTVVPMVQGLNTTSFIEKIKQGEIIPFKCNYKCLRTCDPQKAP